MLFVLALLILEINNFASWARMLHCTRQYSGRIRPEETAILGSREEKSPVPQKNLPKKSKNWDIFWFPSPNGVKFCPILAISHNWGKKTQISGATRHFWTIFDLAPPRVAQNPGRKQIIQVSGVGKETGFVARILTGGTGSSNEIMPYIFELS